MTHTGILVLNVQNFEQRSDNSLPLRNDGASGNGVEFKGEPLESCAEHDIAIATLVRFP